MGKRTPSSRSVGWKNAHLKGGLEGVDGLMGERTPSSRSVGGEGTQLKGDFSPLRLKMRKKRRAIGHPAQRALGGITPSS